MTTFEEAVARVHAAGFHVLNCFELTHIERGSRQHLTWQANIKTNAPGEYYSEFGRGTSAAEALLKTLDNVVKNAPHRPAPRPAFPQLDPFS